MEPNRFPRVSRQSLETRISLSVRTRKFPWHVPSSASSSARKPKASTSLPYPGELGKRIFENVSKEAWAGWLKHQTMLVNENRLNLADARARQYLARQMEQHFFGGGADAAAGYVPPSA